MHEHFAHIHKDRAFLTEAVTGYLSAALDKGHAAIVIARSSLRETLAARLGANRALHILDAERTLARFMRDGMPEWQLFQNVVGGLIAEARLKSGGVSAYGEMVDILWQRGERDAAIRLEEFWNELARLQTFSLFCAYHLDSLDDVDGLARICRVHTCVVPARDHSIVDRAVARAAEEVFERPLSKVLLSLAESHRHGAQMPAGQSMLLWLHRNMPRTAGRVLARVRESMAMEIA